MTTDFWLSYIHFLFKRPRVYFEDSSFPTSRVVLKGVHSPQEKWRLSCEISWDNQHLPSGVLDLQQPLRQQRLVVSAAFKPSLWFLLPAAACPFIYPFPSHISASCLILLTSSLSDNKLASQCTYFKASALVSFDIHPWNHHHNQYPSLSKFPVHPYLLFLHIPYSPGNHWSSVTFD